MATNRCKARPLELNRCHTGTATECVCRPETQPYAGESSRFRIACWHPKDWFYKCQCTLVRVTGLFRATSTSTVIRCDEAALCVSDPEDENAHSQEVYAAARSRRNFKLVTPRPAITWSRNGRVT
ncbi:hypothetical protein C8Q78DRAFT_743001 [Trametes maxima]|nr:hypothetical protein C8Q78DRAFT_743001 [Trametes maxima]